jgi:hypothetical protein
MARGGAAGGAAWKFMAPHPTRLDRRDFRSPAPCRRRACPLQGLTWEGVLNSWLLGTTVFAAFGAGGYALVCLYFIFGTLVTKVKLEQKQKEGIAEARSGRRGAVRAGQGIPRGWVGSGHAWLGARSHALGTTAERAGPKAGRPALPREAELRRCHPCGGPRGAGPGAALGCRCSGRARTPGSRGAAPAPPPLQLPPLPPVPAPPQGSVWGSGSAGIICAALALLTNNFHLYQVGSRFGGAGAGTPAGSEAGARREWERAARSRRRPLARPF